MFNPRVSVLVAVFAFGCGSPPATPKAVTQAEDSVDPELDPCDPEEEDCVPEPGPDGEVTYVSDPGPDYIDPDSGTDEGCNGLFWQPRMQPCEDAYRQGGDACRKLANKVKRAECFADIEITLFACYCAKSNGECMSDFCAPPCC